MAPEVMRKEEITEKVDVYSIGIIMWELLTREDPFADHEDYQTFGNAVCKERERPILPPWTPKKLHALITSCWDEDQNKRLSMAEIITLMDSCMDEIVTLEYAQKIDAAVDDANGRIFWKKKFPLKVPAFLFFLFTSSSFFFSFYLPASLSLVLSLPTSILILTFALIETE